MLGPEEEETLKTYSLVASGWDEVSPPKDKTPEWSMVSDLLDEGAVVLDLGCGTASDFEMFSAFGYKYVGIDLCPEMIAEARRKYDVEVYVMNMKELTFESNSFDAFMCATSFMHIPSRELLDTLRGVLRVIKPGGVGLFSLPVGDFEGCFQPESAPGRVFCTTWEMEPLRNIVVEAGFHILWQECMSQMIVMSVQKP